MLHEPQGEHYSGLKVNRANKAVFIPKYIEHVHIRFSTLHLYWISFWELLEHAGRVTPFRLFHDVQPCQQSPFRPRMFIAPSSYR